ncbi:NAD(P)/FAD-dependent oxidoreductase [Arthrobacter celericrescens]|uniref:NAD(P)/FAD-dependent oxidoreductase n=1 Tax=Arthrobacter celericrescens TaxID=2320851 RepID=UPI000EA0B587|nr:FAD-dependent oxidoreductase [Arthrobacter celericrescens]
MSQPPQKKLTVVGAGVIGLTTACVAARAGHNVNVVSAHHPEDTVSAVAAAIWAPYHARPKARVLSWARTSYRTFSSMAEFAPESGVRMLEGLVVHRSGHPAPSWPESVPGRRPASPEDLPEDAIGGTVCTVPVISMERYLPWLVARCERLGVTFQWHQVTSLDDLCAAEGDIVLATGLRSYGLHQDEGLYPVKGQIVTVRDVETEGWIIDDANPAGPAYIIPREGSVICGGTADAHTSDPAPDPRVARRILATAQRLAPALATGTVSGSTVGFRPCRVAVRLDEVRQNNTRIFHSYGHGGSGVTVSWGVAHSTLDLIDRNDTQWRSQA